MNLECFYFMRTIVFINSFVDNFPSFISLFNTQKKLRFSIVPRMPYKQFWFGKGIFNRRNRLVYFSHFVIYNKIIY